MYRLGDTIAVKVKNANKEAKTVDFEIAEDTTEILEV